MHVHERKLCVHISTDVHWLRMWVASSIFYLFVQMNDRRCKRSDAEEQQPKCKHREKKERQSKNRWIEMWIHILRQTRQTWDVRLHRVLSIRWRAEIWDIHTNYIDLRLKTQDMCIENTEIHLHVKSVHI